MAQLTKRPKFSPGHVRATSGAIKALSEAKEHWLSLLDRHIHGNWGDVSASDAVDNDLAIRLGLLLRSVYTLSTGARLWIITEADRSSTCILLPEEY